MAVHPSTLWAYGERKKDDLRPTWPTSLPATIIVAMIILAAFSFRYIQWFGACRGDKWHYMTGDGII